MVRSSAYYDAGCPLELCDHAAARDLWRLIYQDAIAFDPVLEHQLISAVNQAGETISLNIPPEMALELNQKLADCWKSAMDRAFENIVVLCDARIRPALYSMIERTIPRLPVLAYDEIVPGTVIEPVETVKVSESAGRLAPQPA